MKKIFMILAVLFILIVPGGHAYAIEDSFYEGEYIPGEYIVKSLNGTGKYRQMKFIRRKSDDRAVYCIEIWKNLVTDKTIKGYNNAPYRYANLDYDDWYKVMLISYYGYGYENHTDPKWYAITQVMIWNVLSPETDVYFTDTLNGTRISKYTEEMNEINNLISKHYLGPSFYGHRFEVKYNETLVLEDTKDRLEEFDLIEKGESVVVKEGNILTVTKKDIGTETLKFENKGDQYKNMPIIYIDDDGQNILAAGKYHSIYMVVNIVLPSTDITITKQDSVTGISQGDAKLEGSKIELLDKDYNLITDGIIGSDNTLTFKDIAYGTYYLHETSPGEGYLLNSDYQEITVSDTSNSYTVYNEVIENKIEITKYLKNTISLETKKENGAVFSIYNQNNELVTTITTNRLGNASITLPYGKYTLKQISGTKNYLNIKDLSFEVVEDNIVQHFDLYNEEITSLVKIINTDSDSNLPILEKGSTFKIKNLDNNRYVKDNDGNHLELITNDLGETDNLILGPGHYQVIQTKVVDGYYINEEVFTFEISDDITFDKDNDGNNYIEIKVSDKKKKSGIDAVKYIEYYFNDKLIKTDEDFNIDLDIYAKEDIYSKDGIKIYTKDELVGNLTADGLTDLVFGTYYLINNKNEEIELVLNNTVNKKVTLYEQIHEYQEEDTIIFNNTSNNKTMLSNISLLPIMLGMYLLKRKNEAK